uniref:uncharacterized protein LOC101291066 isoform X2 n=1 Tax=Fragaria vesca subsp. vesca TaxID=101020 RepID=UPI0005C8D28C|nr:PREDICTED: uncharacterized protein LOC101291066 isoform X2 [Fragaria vesca subsp. vesca]
MIELQCRLKLGYPIPPKNSSVGDFTSKLKPPSPSPSALLLCTNFNSSLTSKRHSFKCFCNKTENTQQVSSSSQGFSALAADSPWDNATLWSTLALYIFSLHIPLSFGGLSVVAHVLHQPILDPQIEAISLLGAQILELIAAVILLQSTAKPQYKFSNFFKPSKLSKERSWLLASAVGFGFLLVLVILTSFLADRFIGPKDLNNSMLKEILVNSNISRAACVFVYCVTTPLLEETVYRGFLLASISSTMKWQSAVFISSTIFSAAHFSGTLPGLSIFFRFDLGDVAVAAFC